MFVQFLANGIVSGCVFALVALGFALIYNTTRTFHFAHGAIYTLAAYLFYTLSTLWGWPLLLSFPLTLGCAALAGMLIDEIVYHPLVECGSSLLIQMLSSLGVYIVIVNFIAMVYGDETKVMSPGLQPVYTLGSVILTRIQIMTSLSFVATFGILITILKKTYLGKLIRAMRDDTVLVAAMGISPRRLRLIVFSFGSTLAAVAAVLRGLDVGIEPHSGMVAMLSGAVALIIGGVGIFEGAALGALLLGVIQSFAVWKGSARWQETVTFLLLIFFLLCRPEGLLGSRRRVEEVVR